MFGMLALIIVILTSFVILGVFIYSLLFRRKKTAASEKSINNQSTRKLFTEDQEQEIKYLLQEIENASRSELKVIMERGVSLLPYECKHLLKVACDERLIRLNHKGRSDTFEMRETSVRRQWLIMFVVYFLLFPLLPFSGAMVLWAVEGIKTFTINYLLLSLLGTFSKAIILYYFAYLKKGTFILTWTLTGYILLTVYHLLIIIKLSLTEDVVNNLILGDFLIGFAMNLIPIWFCYRLYKINCEFKGRELFRSVNI
ncbi:MAG: hypothetical protein H0T62_08975 [Parachlamydiaceae bacterium]|nr:hypothetical protein [Parachlamydiaceae bacterium]